MAEPQIRVLLVCLGNICRSPTAEGVLRQRAEGAGWGKVFVFDSAGTAGYHIGEPPDIRSQQHAHGRGYDISRLRARELHPADFRQFDYVLAMDAANLRFIRHMQEKAGGRAETGLLLDYHPQRAGEDVPDPYYGGPDGFETVLDLVEEASDGLLRALLKKQGLFGCGC